MRIKVEKLYKQLTEAGLNARRVMIYNTGYNGGSDVPGIMVSHNYQGLYPVPETWQARETVRKLARSAGFPCEDRGFYTATLIYCV